VGIPLHKRRDPLPASQRLSAPAFTLTRHHFKHSDYLDVHLPIDRGCKERYQEGEPPKACEEVIPADLFVTVDIKRLEQPQHLSKVYIFRWLASLMATQRYAFVAEEQRRLTPSSDGRSMLNRRTSTSCPLEMSDVSGSLHFSKAVSHAPWNNGCFLRCAHPTKNCTHDTHQGHLVIMKHTVPVHYRNLAVACKTAWLL